MKIKSILVILLFLFSITFITQSTLGQLVWQQRTVDRRADLDDLASTVDYHFTNQGDYPVTIKSVKSGCGCTTAKLEKHTYQPGDAGTITLTFTFGNKTGRQRNHAIVRTDDPNHPSTVLALQVLIPEILRFTPEKLMWKPDEPRTPKTIQIEVVHDEPVHIMSADTKTLTMSRPKPDSDETSTETETPKQPVAFKSKLKVLEKTKLYEVEITPPQDTELPPVSAKLTLKTDMTIDCKPRNFNISLHAFSKHRPEMPEEVRKAMEARRKKSTDRTKDK